MVREAGATVDYTMFGQAHNTDCNSNDISCTVDVPVLRRRMPIGLRPTCRKQPTQRPGRIHPVLEPVETQPLTGGTFSQILYGPLDFSSDHWAGPGGFGPPGGQGDWAASMHDYNFSTNGPIKIGITSIRLYRLLRSKALIQSNSNLIRNAGGVQGAKMGMFFGVVNAFQWYANSWK